MIFRLTMQNIVKSIFNIVKIKFKWLGPPINNQIKVVIRVAFLERVVELRPAS